MFGKKMESKTSEYRPMRNPDSETQDRASAQGGQSAPMPQKPSIVRGGSTPAPLKPSGTVSTRILETLHRREGSVSLEPSIIREGFEFVGDMKAGGSLTVDGTIKGNLAVQTLSIGATGLVDGSVHADSVNVEGCLSGDVECKDLVVGSRAVVDGKLSYSTIAIQRGATIKGSLKRA